MTDGTDGAQNIAGWIAGGAIAGWALATIALVLAAIVGLAIVVGFGLGEGAGVPVYSAAIAGGALLYAVLLRLGIAHARLRGPIPWVIWPALAAFPLLWALLAALYTPRGIVEPLVSYVACAGLVAGWAAATWDKTRGERGVVRA